MNEANPDSLQQIEHWRDQHADEIGRRAVARAVRTVIWNRRLWRMNGTLGAAVLLMAAQVAWGFLLLARLQGVTSSLPPAHHPCPPSLPNIPAQHCFPALGG